MIGALIGAGLSVASGVIGGISAANARKKQLNAIRKQERENENWYNRRINEDVTQRADAQHLLTQLNESIKNRNKASAGTRAVMGGTEESVAADKAANAKALSDATANIAATADARKDAVEQQYRNTKQSLEAQRAGLAAQQAQETAVTAQQAAATAANIANALDGGKESDSGKTTEPAEAPGNTVARAATTIAADKAAREAISQGTQADEQEEIRQRGYRVNYNV